MASMKNVGAYSKNALIEKNKRENRNFGTKEKPDKRIVYTCLISITCESKWTNDDGSEIYIQETPIVKKLIGIDSNDYKLTQWTATEISDAISIAIATAEKEIKTK